MRVGVTLPQFRGDPSEAIEAALAADATEGIDGVFAFDHLWAVGRPGAPAVSAWPLLGALAASTERVVLGPLVARVTLQPPAVLAHQVETMLGAVGAERFVAALGAGDRLSEPENHAYGVPFPPLGERLAMLADAVRRCVAIGATTWVGGMSPKVREVAVREGVGLNLWGAGVERVSLDRGAVREVTWAGVLHEHVEDGDADATGGFLRRLAQAGATWAICAPRYVQGEPPGEVIAVLGRAATQA